MTEQTESHIDPRGWRPKATGLNWRIMTYGVPLYTGTFFLAMLGIALAVPPVAQRLTVAIVVTALSLTVLDRWLRPRISLTWADEKRERTWNPAGETPQLIARQSFRYLAISLPLIVLTSVLAAALVGVVMRNFGLW